MKNVLLIAGLSKQAHHQYNRRHSQDTHRWGLLLEEVALIREVHPGCGVEKLYDAIKPSWVGRDIFCSTLIQMGYRVVQHRNFIRTTISTCYQYYNLIEGMAVTDQDQIWQSDITYFKIGSEFYYLVFIMDIYTKEILGYQASDHMQASANLKALNMAIRCRGSVATGLIHHSDRGTQYGEKHYVELLKQNNIQISMGICATENAYAERINGTIKNEYLKYWEIKSLAQLRSKLKAAVKHYNTKRQHKHLPGKRSPVSFTADLSSWPPQARPVEIVYSKGNQQLKRPGVRNRLDYEVITRTQCCPIEMKVNNQ